MTVSCHRKSTATVEFLRMVTDAHTVRICVPESLFFVIVNNLNRSDWNMYHLRQTKINVFCPRIPHKIQNRLFFL
jgi:hypothetical protein